MASPKAIFKNAAGSVMVDRTYKNLQFLYKENKSSGVQHIRASRDKPWVWAVHSPQGTVFASAYNPYLARGGRQNSFDMWYLSGAATLYHFGIKPFVKAQEGLNIYDDNGNLVFSSNIQPMRVVDFVYGKLNVDEIVNGKVIYNKTFKAGRKYAVILGQYAYRYWSGSKTLYCFAPKITTNDVTGNVKIEFVTAGATSSGAYRGNLYTNDYNYLIVDVTHF